VFHRRLMGKVIGTNAAPSDAEIAGPAWQLWRRLTSRLIRIRRGAVTHLGLVMPDRHDAVDLHGVEGRPGGMLVRPCTSSWAFIQDGPR
jgi:hypothetical protein